MSWHLVIEKCLKVAGCRIKANQSTLGILTKNKYLFFFRQIVVD